MVEPPLPPWPRGATPVSPADAYAGTWARSAGAMRPAARADVWAAIERAYSGRPGALDRVVDALGFVGACLLAGEFAVACLPAVEWATWFHAAVPAAAAGSEPADGSGAAAAAAQASAALAARVLGAAGMGAAMAARVGELVVAAGRQAHGGDAAAAVVADAALAGFGGPLPRYAAYAGALRAEHPQCSDAEYAAARSKLLRALLEREQLFATATGSSLLESEARANAAHELQLASVGLVLSPDDELPAVAEGEEGEDGSGSGGGGGG